MYRGRVRLRKLAKDQDLSKGVAAIKFSATWCGPCHIYAPVFKRAEARYEDVDFFEVDVDQEPDIREKFGVTVVPTTIILKDGHVLVDETGAKSTRQLDELFNRVLSYPNANSTTTLPGHT